MPIICEHHCVFIEAVSDRLDFYLDEGYQPDCIGEVKKKKKKKKDKNKSLCNHDETFFFLMFA